MQQFNRQLRKSGKAIGRFFERIRKGSILDIAILVCSVSLVIVVAAIFIFAASGQQRPASSAPLPSSVSAPDESPAAPAVSDSGSSEEPPASSSDLTAFEGVVLPESADGGESYVTETLFIGDSNTYRLAAPYELTSWQNNLSAVGMGIQHVTATPCMYFEGTNGAVFVSKAVAMMQPRRIIMTFGTNNTDWSAQTFIKQYRNAMIAITREWPYADIIINAIPPVVSTRTGAADQQKAIDSFNEALMQFAKDDGYKFLNSAEALRDATGYGKASFFIDDGIHLSKEGANALMNYVRTHTYLAEDRRPALQAVPKHTATPEETFNPKKDDDSSSSSSAKGVRINFYISQGKDYGTLSGTLEQTVAPGQACSAVTLKLKEGCTAVWGCTEGSIERGLTKTDSLTQTLVFTVPPTELKSIDVWVSITQAHKHTWGDWKDLGDGTHQGRCVAPNCPENGTLSPIEAHEWGPTSQTDGTRSCTKCGASGKDPAWTPPASDPTPPSSDLTPPASDPTPPSSDPTPPSSDPTPPASDPTPPASDPTPPASDATPPAPEPTPEPAPQEPPAPAPGAE